MPLIHPPSGKHAQFTLRFSLGTAFVGVVVLASSLLGVCTFLSVSAFVRQGVRERLSDAAGIAALGIDAEIHATLQARSDEDSAAYRGIRDYLRNVRGKSQDIRFVYTVRKNADGQIVFVVDAEESPEEVSHLGEVYEGSTADLRAAFEKPYGIQVGKEFYTDKWGTFLSSHAPILRKNGELEAVLGMDITAQKVIAYERTHMLMLLGLSLAVCAAVAMLGIIISRRISTPLMLLEADMSRIQKFDLDGTVDIHSRITEVVKMKTAVDNMKSGLRSFQKYVPAALVAELIHLRQEATLGVEKRELSVFFSDIADFTSISERISPELLARHMGAYFEGMTETLMRHQGTVDKFIGDAIMAFWGAPTPADNHAELACRAALRCGEFSDALSADLAAAGLPPLVTRIGVSFGEAIVGNMGYKDRMSYTAIGDTVNLASRLEGLNKRYGTRVLVSEAMFARVKELFVARPVDIVAVKGKNEGTKIYELIAERDKADDGAIKFAARCDEGFSWYLRREWTKAAECFAAARTMKPDDTASRLLGERCADYQREPPPAEWRGVTVLREK